FVLFVRPRDREMEIWNGRRAGVEGAVATYGADAAYVVDDLDAKLREYAVDRPAVVYRLGNPQHDGRVTRLLAEIRSARTPNGLVAPTRGEEPCPVLDEPPPPRSPAALARPPRARPISRAA